MNELREAIERLKKAIDAHEEAKSKQAALVQEVIRLMKKKSEVEQ